MHVRVRAQPEDFKQIFTIGRVVAATPSNAQGGFKCMHGCYCPVFWPGVSRRFYVERGKMCVIPALDEETHTKGSPKTQLQDRGLVTTLRKVPRAPFKHGRHFKRPLAWNETAPFKQMVVYGNRSFFFLPCLSTTPRGCCQS